MSPVLEVRNTAKHFTVYSRTGKKNVVKALNSVTFDLHAGQVLGIVGESGSGKSTLSKLIMGLLTPDKGDIVFKGQSLKNFSPSEWKLFSKAVQPVFQDPVSSFNPVMTVEQIVKEPLDIHNICDESEKQLKVRDILSQCGLSDDIISRKTSKMSGGQRQRVGIARALVLSPEILIADEPVSALDKPTSERILSLMSALIQKKDMSMVFITHDIAAVKAVCDTILVMFEGYVVEHGPVKEVFKHPRHPYTALLIDAFINYSKESMLCNTMMRKLDKNDHGGCPFKYSCPFEQKVCRHTFPEYRTDNGHSFLCHFEHFNVIK